jgi:hypothetical protein
MFRVTWLDNPGVATVPSLNEARELVGSDLWETDDDRRAWWAGDFSAVVDWITANPYAWEPVGKAPGHLEAVA